MIDRQLLRENPDAIRGALDEKGVTDVNLDQILTLDQEWRERKARGDELRHERNQISSKIGKLKAAGDEDAASEAIAQSQELKK